MLEKMRHEPALSTLQAVISMSAPERAPKGVPVLSKPTDIEVLTGLMRRVRQCP
jgi:hypothetical protein